MHEVVISSNDSIEKEDLEQNLNNILSNNMIIQEYTEPRLH